MRQGTHIIIIIFVCVLLFSKGVRSLSEDGETAVIEGEITIKEPAACPMIENSTTTTPEPIREIVSDEVDTDTFTIRSEGGEHFRKTILRLDAPQTPSSSKFKFLELHSSGGESVLAVDGEGRVRSAGLETENVHISSTLSVDEGRLSLEKGILSVDKGTLSVDKGRIDVQKSDVTISESNVRIVKGQLDISTDEEFILRAETNIDNTTLFEIEGNGRTNIHRGGIHVDSGGLHVVSGGIDLEAGGLRVQAGGLNIADGGIVTKSTAGLGIEVGGGGLFSTNQQNAAALKIKALSQDFINTIAALEGESKDSRNYNMMDARHHDVSVFTIRGDGKTSIESEVDSSKVGTGALHVRGGASIGKNLHVGNGVYARDFVSTGTIMRLQARGGEIELDAGDPQADDKEEAVVTLTHGVLRSASETPLKLLAYESEIDMIAQNGDIRLESSDHIRVEARTGDVRVRTSNEVSVSAVSDVTIETTTGDVRLATTGVGKAVRIDADMSVSRDLRVANRLAGSVISDGMGVNIQNGTITAKMFRDETGARLESGSMRLSSLTDGVATLSAGSLSGCEHVNSKSVSSNSITDGILTLTQGTIKNAKTISTKHLTDGVASLTDGDLKNLRSLSASSDASFGGDMKIDGEIQVGNSVSASGGALFGGNVKIEGEIRVGTSSSLSVEGDLQGLKSLESESISDGVSTLHQGKLNLKELDSNVLRLSSQDRYDREITLDESSIQVKNSDLTISLDESRSVIMNGNIRLGNGFSIQDTSNLHRWPDFVFESDYVLRDFDSLREYVQKEKHLPEIPSRDEWIRRGAIDQSEMIRSLLLKVEELTLYTLELDERMRVLEEKIKSNE